MRTASSGRTPPSPTPGAMLRLLAPANRGLHFEEFLQPELAAFAAQTGLLVAPERRTHAAERAVDVHVARAQLARHFACALVRPLHVRRQAVRRVVGDGDGFVLAIV